VLTISNPLSAAPTRLRGYNRVEQEYLDASSPRSQQICEYLERTGRSGKEAAEIAAHSTRDRKKINSPGEVRRMREGQDHVEPFLSGTRAIAFADQHPHLKRAQKTVFEDVLSSPAASKESKVPPARQHNHTHSYSPRRRNARLSGRGLRTDIPCHTPTEFFLSQLWSTVTVKSSLICVQPYCIVGLEGKTLTGMRCLKRS